MLRDTLSGLRALQLVERLLLEQGRLSSQTAALPEAGGADDQWQGEGAAVTDEAAALGLITYSRTGPNDCGEEPNPSGKVSPCADGVLGACSRWLRRLAVLQGAQRPDLEPRIATALESLATLVAHQGQPLIETVCARKPGQVVFLSLGTGARCAEFGSDLFIELTRQPDGFDVLILSAAGFGAAELDVGRLRALALGLVASGHESYNADTVSQFSAAELSAILEIRLPGSTDRCLRFPLLATGTVGLDRLPKLAGALKSFGAGWNGGQPEAFAAARQSLFDAVHDLQPGRRTHRRPLSVDGPDKLLNVYLRHLFGDTLYERAKTYVNGCALLSSQAQLDESLRSIPDEQTAFSALAKADSEANACRLKHAFAIGRAQAAALAGGRGGAQVDARKTLRRMNAEMLAIAAKKRKDGERLAEPLGYKLIADGLAVLARQRALRTPSSERIPFADWAQLQAGYKEQRSLEAKTSLARAPKKRSDSRGVQPAARRTVKMAAASAADDEPARVLAQPQARLHGARPKPPTRQESVDVSMCRASAGVDDAPWRLQAGAFARRALAMVLADGSLLPEITVSGIAFRREPPTAHGAVCWFPVGPGRNDPRSFHFTVSPADLRAHEFHVTRTHLGENRRTKFSLSAALVDGEYDRKLPNDELQLHMVGANTIVSWGIASRAFVEALILEARREQRRLLECLAGLPLVDDS